MGKSDPIIFSKYLDILRSSNNKKYKNVCFLGFDKPNNLTRSISCENSDFYDLSLENWNINDKKWNINTGIYDLVVCTRCPYFSKSPRHFMEECCRILADKGALLVDWGLGDHWRFENYKIGWVKNNEHEFSYNKTNYLWSCIWDDSFTSHIEYKKFESWTRKFGYDNVKDAIQAEVPSILNISEISNKFLLSVDMLALWENSPQLYIIVFGEKNENN
jgi:SAM-dependent methyltransferase